MNRNIQKIILVTCPKCKRESRLYIDVIQTVGLEGIVNTKGQATKKPSCSCKELEEEFDSVYEKIQV